MNYGEILSKAWKIIWKYKILWLFGILASCTASHGGGGGGSGGSGGGGTNFNFPGPNNGGYNGDFERMFPWAQDFARQVEQAVNNGTFWAYLAIAVVVLFCLGVILWLIGLAVGSIGEGGLVSGAWAGDEGVASFSLSDAWNGAKPHFGKIFLFHLIFDIVALLVGFFLVVLITIPIVALTVLTLGIGLLCLIPLFCVLIPVMILLGWAISILVRFTIIAMVGENLGILDAIQRAWEVLKRNFWPTILMSLILNIGAFIIGVILILPFLLVIIPALIGFAAQTNTGIVTGLIVSGALFLIYLVIVTILGGILEAYLWAAWSLVFRRLTGRLAGEAGLIVNPENPQFDRIVEAPVVETDAELPPTEPPVE